MSHLNPKVSGPLGLLTPQPRVFHPSAVTASSGHSERNGGQVLLRLGSCGRAVMYPRNRSDGCFPRLVQIQPESQNGSNSCRMNTYKECDVNSFRMRTYKVARCKSSRMNTYKKQGEGCLIMLPNPHPGRGSFRVAQALCLCALPSLAPP
jgi:hypothetical protein